MKNRLSSEMYWIAGAAVAFIVIVAIGLGVGNRTGPTETTPTKTTFDFIPGHAILEKNDTIRYVVSELSSAENADAAVNLWNVIATKDMIRVTVDIARKGITEEQGMKELNSEWGRHATLHADHLPSAGYEALGGGGGGTLFRDYTFLFSLKPEDIKPDATYRFELIDYRLALDFKLKNYETFERLDQIGATETHNDISITAVPTRKNGVLTVELYEISKSKYHVSSFSNGGGGYRGQDLRLETSSGDQKWRKIQPLEGPNRRVFFDVSPGDKDLVLKIPHLMVFTAESRTVKLTVPPIGHKVVVNEKVEFDDATMTIVDVEKTLSSPDLDLTMTLKYDNKRPNMAMFFAGIEQVDFWDERQPVLGYSTSPDSSETYVAAVHYHLEKGSSVAMGESPLRLRISSPVYYLLDGYTIKLDK